MRVRTPDYYKNFQCIGKKCTDSCCTGWEVDLDDASLEYYRSVEGEFGERLRSVMVFEEGENRFKLRANGRCPFLNDENLCDLYFALGEDRLCKTCTEHPRYMNDFGDLREKGISLSCPEAARIILSKKTPVTYDTVVTDEMVAEFSSLDPQKYVQLVMARKNAYAVAGNREQPIRERIAQILEEGIVHQRQLTGRKVNKDAAQLMTNRAEVLAGWLHHIENYECINPVWNELVQSTIRFLEDASRDYEKSLKEFEEANASKLYQYEQMTMYFLYRYYVSSVFDYDLLSKLKLMAFGVLICEAMAVVHWDKRHRFTLRDQVQIMHCFSRQFEHSDENVGAINRSFAGKELFDIRQFLEIL